MNNTCRYHGKTGHLEKTCWKKSVDLEEKVKIFEGGVVVVHETSILVDDFNLNLRNSQALLAQNSQNEWVDDSGCTHHMAKDSSLFSFVDTTSKNNIYVADDFSLETTSRSDVTCQHYHIFDVFHVPCLSVNLFSISKLTQTSMIVLFCPYHLFIKDLNKYRSIIIERSLNPKY